MVDNHIVMACTKCHENVALGEQKVVYYTGELLHGVRSDHALTVKSLQPYVVPDIGGNVDNS